MHNKDDNYNLKSMHFSAGSISCATCLRRMFFVPFLIALSNTAWAQSYCSDFHPTGSTGDGSSVANAAPSCRAILVNHGVTTDGVYWIDVDGDGGFAAARMYCDMTSDGGGWTLVQKSKFSSWNSASKIELTGDASLSGTTDPWSGAAISTIGTEWSKFVTPSFTGNPPMGFNAEGLLSPNDNLLTTAPQDSYAIIHRGMIEALRTNCSAGDRLLTALRQSEGSTDYYIQSAKRFNPIQHKCATNSGICNATDFSGCAAEMILPTEIFSTIDASNNVASSQLPAGNWAASCAGLSTSGALTDQGAPMGWFGGNSNSSVKTGFYDLSDSNGTSSGPITNTAFNHTNLALCVSSASCPFTTLWVKDAESPTQVELGEVGIEYVKLDDLTNSMLRAILNSFAEFPLGQGSNAKDLIQQVATYLDPDGDGWVGEFRWETLSQTGTLGFYVERQQNNGRWQRLQSKLLPAVIPAPYGAEYRIWDPSAIRSDTLVYRLIEQETNGQLKTYGPFQLQ